ncbi:hypothetical protein Taro_019907 [Colocasia esculenta]|uniref:U6 snRNA phosphodiesterase n=1 Tax=Colocasia esculenta TaxID=4460 RepID=A0A843UV29_COLES|nr:hypothetical protein [Colocasia esculenta]
MEALRASYGSDSESDDASPKAPAAATSGACSGRPPCGDVLSTPPQEPVRLPPPPLDLLGDLPHSFGPSGYSSPVEVNRIRSFPHVEGNYALHVFVPVTIPSTARKQLVSFVKRVASRVPELFAVDVDIPLDVPCNEDKKLEQIFGREFHISLGRTVPIRVHQIDSIVNMLLQKLQSQKQYWIEFSRWEVFVNDDQTRSFISLEVKGAGLSEITKQIQIVNDVYRLHGLPEFYKNPRPHISLVWALGDVSRSLKQAIEDQSKCSNDLSSPRRHIFMCKFNGIECKIGKKSYSVCKFPC